MVTYISLLRGINVSGKNLIKMQELIRVYQGLGFSDIRTYLQSGNVVFQCNRMAANKLAKTITAKLQQHFGVPIPVALRTAEELQAIIRSNPFLKSRAVDPGKLHVTFLSQQPSAAAEAKARAIRDPQDQMLLAGQEIYLHCPNGYGRTKLTNTFFEKLFGLTATTRNWNTATKLGELALGANAPDQLPKK